MASLASTEKWGVWILAAAPPSLYTPGSVRKQDWLDATQDTVPVYVTGQPGPVSVPRSQVWRRNDDLPLAASDDLTRLTYLDEANILATLAARYTQSSIYTSMARILIAINPYRELPLYDITHYQRSRSAGATAPHVFGVAQQALDQMQRVDPRTLQHQPQSIICCGESGSGKTVSTKQILRYLCQGSGAAASHLITQHILDANPVLEAFGNAQTLRNHNSSRFAKFIKLHFDGQTVQAAHTETYLLERSRLVSPPVGERNFHALYYVAAQRHPKVTFAYLGPTPPPSDAALQFQTLEQCLQHFRIKGGALDHVWRVVSGLLHLGNVTVEPDGPTTAEFTMTPTATQWCHKTAKFWGLEANVLQRYLETRNLYVNKEVVNMRLSWHDARVNRDALAKFVYVRLFDWLVQAINQIFEGGADTGKVWIGLLDVFGFESFACNSFEQFCINLANEKLQNFFNQYVLASEQAEYLREAIVWHPVAVQDNSDTVALLEGRPSGILSLLDSTCVMPNGTPEILVNTIFSYHSKHPRLQRPPGKGLLGQPRNVLFGVTHYADTVYYTTEQFLHKNNDSQNTDLLQLLSGSQIDLLQALSSASQSTVKSARFSSVSRVFQQQLHTLMETLHSTTPYFVRCINPNASQKAQKFDVRYIQPQIKLGGLLQAVEMLKYGYPFRLPYADLALPLVPRLSPRYVPYALDRPVFLRNICEGLLRFVYPGQAALTYQLGLTKIFFKAGNHDEVLEWTRRPLTTELATAIHRWIKKRRWDRMKTSLLAMQWMGRRVAGIRRRYQWRHLTRMLVVINKTWLRVLHKVRAGRPPLPVVSAPAAPLRTLTPPPPPTPPAPVAEQTQQIAASLAQMQQDVARMQFEREVLLQEQARIQQEGRRTAEALEHEFQVREQELRVLLDQKERDWETKYHALCAEKEQTLSALAQRESELATTLQTKADEVEQKVAELKRVLEKQQALEQLLGEREQTVNHAQRDNAELRQQQQRLAHDLQNSVARHARDLEEQKQALMLSYRRESREAKTWFQSSLESTQASMAQHEQALRAKDKLIDKLQRHIETLEADLNRRVTDYQTSVQQVYERRIRELERTVQKQRAQILRWAS